MPTSAANALSLAGRLWPALMVLLALLVAAAPEPAAAQSLDKYRAGGHIGERFDGYAMATQPNPSAAIKKLVRSVNAQRRGIYQQRAQQQKVPADQVGRVYAQQILKKAPSGTYFLGENGKWVRK